MLKPGDVIQIEPRHRVYAELPEFLVFKNKKGSKEFVYTDVSVKEYPHLEGKYIVDRVSLQGGGTGHGRFDVYPHGHCVYCISENGDGRKIHFYQSGCFTAMIYPKDIRVVGHAEKTWKTQKQFC